MSARPRVSFIVPVNNAAAHLRRCLESIRGSGLGRDDIEILVAVAGATDGSDAIARNLGAVVLPATGQNAASARNHAARHATADILAFVDADHEIGEAWAPVALELFARPDVVGVGAPYQTPPDGNWVQHAYDSFRRRSRSQEDTAWLASGNLAVRREVFERLGGFDASLDSCEDVDLCYRLVRTGGRLVSDPRLTSVHHGDPRSLRALFFGELWRGRDNFTVSFRYPMTWRDLPSILAPAVVLAALAALPLGVLTWSLGGRWIAAGAVLALAAPAGARALAMTARRRDTGGALTFLQSLVVASVYEVARAMALVGKAGHDVRRRA